MRLTVLGRRFLVDGSAAHGLRSMVLEADESAAHGLWPTVYGPRFRSRRSVPVGITVAEIRPVCHVIEGEAAIRRSDGKWSTESISLLVILN